MVDITKVTNTVIHQNTVMGYNIQTNQIDNRHYISASIDISKLDETANVSAVQSNLISTNSNSAANDFATWNSAKANDFATYFSALANDLVTWNSAKANDVATLDSAKANDYSTWTAVNTIVNTVQSNLTSLISGATQFVATKTFQNDVVVIGDFTVLGNTFTANVGNITSEDNTIIINWNGSNATAEVAGIAVAGTDNQILANISYSDSSPSKFRVGTGVLGSADNLAREQDYQANDNVTYLAALANDLTTWNSAKANDLVTYLAALANDLVTWNSAKANDHITWVAINANLDAVQDNVDSAQSALEVSPWHISNASSTSSNVYLIDNPGSITDATYIKVFLGGIAQPNTEWVFNSGNSSIQFKDETMLEGETVIIDAFYTTA